jgi:methyl-accepting chemotaxis protein
MGTEEYLTVSSFKILWKNEILPSLKVEFAELIHKEVSMQIDVLSKRFDKVEQAQRFLSDKYDNIIESIQSTKSHMQNMEKKTNDQQFNINENDTQIGKTQDSIYENEATMDEMQKYIRRDCLEILGIPVLPDEKPNELITELAEQLGVELSTDEISTAHRLPDTKNQRIIS